MLAASSRIPRLRGPPSQVCAALERLVAPRLAFSTAARMGQQEVTKDAPAEDPGARIPLSIQSIYYKPFRRQPTHGLPVCDLQLRSYSVRNLDFMCDFALRAAYYCNLPASGPVPLPKKIERWTVPRSNFVHKKSQENFERITHKRLIQIKDGNPETVELWLAFLRKHQFYGVGLKANVWDFNELGVGKRMNVSLETLRDVQRPKFAHFGPRKTVETAEKVREILETDKFKGAANSLTAAIALAASENLADFEPATVTQHVMQEAIVRKAEIVSEPVDKVNEK
ncbi:mitochondrial 37S ribosomal protein rsm10 [Rhizina undulata]